MKKIFRRVTALTLAMLIAAGSTLAAASEAMGTELHKGYVTLSQGSILGKALFWSDTYSDLRTEHYVTYTPNAGVTPTVAYGDKILSRATLAGMAQNLEAQGNRVVSGINGDYYVMATGAPIGMVVSDGVLRSTPPYKNSWAVGFLPDGTAFTSVPNLSVVAAFGGSSMYITGGVNKVRKLSAADGTGGLTLLTSDFSATTKNTEPGVDVILAPMDDGTGNTAVRIGRTVTYTVEQVLESSGAIAIPEGKAVLTMNGTDKADILATLRTLTPGATVTVTATSVDNRWNDVTQALGGMYKMVSNGVVEKNLSSERTARSAIGIKADGTIIFYTMDGKQNGHSVGATMTQVAMRLIELGCVDAICLDGGGSTTIGATYPDQNGMTVVNKPSDGAQRANSTAIFLTSRLQPVGDVASYYVTPSDSMVLAGATLYMTATALDSSYLPSTGGAPYYSMSSGGGTVTESGAFTAGNERGFSVLSASDGAASGSAYVTTIATPDSIKIINEGSGAAVSGIALNPKEQANLKASSSYKDMALISQDNCYTWTLDPAVGTVDGQGVITAGDKTASGNLTVSAGGKSVTIQVNVAGHVKTLEGFESGAASFTAGSGMTVTPESNLNYVHNGKGSMKLAYDATAGTASATANLPVPAGDHYLGLWVYGDGSGNTLLATSTGTDGLPYQTLLTALDFTGWKHLSVAMPQGTVAVNSLDVIYGGGAGKQSGSLWVDHITASNEVMHDNAAPNVSVTAKGTQLTASALDNVDRSLPKENIQVTYDGANIAFEWSAVTGVVKATLPAANDRYHRVTVTATDLSGNISRGSADIAPATARNPVFSDMTGSWAASYATWLYDNGVANGVAGATGILFQPNKNITRAEFFAMVARWMKVDLSQYAGVELPFADKAAIPSWALGEVKAMYAMGIVTGSDNGAGLTVSANATLTRAEAMAILGRTQQKGFAEGSLSFADSAKVPQWAAPYVKTLVAQGVVAGYNNLINPTNPVNRAEVAKMLYTMK